MTNELQVPGALRKWFIFHFWADIVFAFPLIFFPQALLGMLGWEVIDPFTARLVGAALVGIGVESLLGRDAPVESFSTMLRMKILWSGSAVVGIFLSMLEGAPTMGWLIFGIFVGFHALWWYWFLRVKGLSEAHVQKV